MGPVGRRWSNNILNLLIGYRTTSSFLNCDGARVWILGGAWRGVWKCLAGCLDAWGVWRGVWVPVCVRMAEWTRVRTYVLVCLVGSLATSDGATLHTTV